MSSSGFSMSSTPFKPKKLLQSTPKSKSTNSIATQTPDKQPAELPPRIRNRRVALSVKEVRQIAHGNRNRTDRIVKSARRKISSWPEESTSGPRKSRDSAAVVDDNSATIPVKDEILGEFFDSLDSSIRLLKLKGSMSTFTNISPKIECLTDRRFSHRHLAQLKYIMPDVIEIKRVLMLDERTSCMKPDLHIALNVNAIECDVNLKSQSKNLHLRKVFRSRLADFYKNRPQGNEIPEELLPEPFNRSKQDQAPASTSATETSTDYVGQRCNLSSPVETEAPENQRPAVASHFSGSFRRHFTQKIKTTEAENAHQNAENLKLGINKISSSEGTSSSAPSPTKVLSPNLTDGSKFLAISEVSASVPTCCLTGTPCEEIDSLENRDGTSKKLASIQSTPAKFVLTPSSSLSTTPLLQPQKRCYMSPDDDSIFAEDKLVRRPFRTRSLKFEGPVNNVEDDGVEDVSGNDDDDVGVLSILPESLLQSIREKERKAQEERDPAISQANRRRQMIACLPKLFNMIHFLFQSIKRSVITKEELMHKIIAGHCDIADSSNREIEEQLNLLLELVPEWISKKLTSSGDLLFCINKMTSADMVRARLEEAK